MTVNGHIKQWIENTRDESDGTDINIAHEEASFETPKINKKITEFN